jgi:uroporphyrinogen III methyltransferase/synthase
VFTSANGVDAFFEQGLAAAGMDARALAGVRVAVIGPGTERALAARGLVADLVPDRAVAEGLLDAFPKPDHPQARVLIARAETARDTVPDGLTEAGYTVDIVAVYRTVRAEPDAAAVTQVREGRVDAITFTSSSTVTNLCDLLGALPDPQPLVVSIGPVTSETARGRGLTVDAEADPHTIDGLVDALVSALQR